jgi:hypothetical protein
MLAGLATLAGMYVMALAFSYLYETYAPATHPITRVFPYAGLVMILAGGALLQWALDRGAALRRPLRRAYRGMLVGAVGLGIAILSIWPGAQLLRTTSWASGLTREGVAGLAWLRGHTAPDARIFTNSRTAGSVEIIGRRMSLTEGRGVYVRPDLLRQVFRVLDQTEQFYWDPTRADILLELGVDYVLVAPSKAIGGWRVVSGDIPLTTAQCEASPALVRVAQFGEVVIFQVVPPVAGASSTGATPGVPCSNLRQFGRCINTW